MKEEEEVSGNVSIIGAMQNFCASSHSNYNFKINQPVEMARQSQFFAANNDDFATLQKVLGNDRCEPTDQMAATVNNYSLQ